MGSGEFLDSMARVHRGLLADLGGPANAVFLDTPAGFELNADELAERAVQYFAQRLDVALGVVSYRSKQAATALEQSAALRLLLDANYLVAGPGSPTYAVRTWRESLVWEAVTDSLRGGATLVLASAAAMAAGRYSIPVYEIYRAGEDPEWIEGLNLLGPFGLELAVVAHWNNSHGGSHDTRFCFMGERRLDSLRSQLAPSTTILGLDEHTACVLDLATRRCRVEGVGAVTVIRGEAWSEHASGSEFGFEELLGLESGRVEPQLEAGSEPTTEPRTLATARYLSELANALTDDPDPAVQREVIDLVHDATHELAEGWREPDSLTGQEIRPLLELLVRARQELRAAKAFGLADEIRDQLNHLGVVEADTPVSRL